MARRSYGEDGIELVSGQIEGPQKQHLLLLFINGRCAEANQTQVELFASLYKNRGSVVQYRELSSIMGHEDDQDKRHSLRQYIWWIKRLLAKHKLPYVIAVAPDLGYALCEIPGETIKLRQGARVVERSRSPRLK